MASSSLFDLSVLKLHHSLRQSEPDLRHLVLVVNTLRRIQASMAPTAALPPVPSPPVAPSVADSLLASSDAALSASMASLLEDLSHIEGLSQAPQPHADEGPPGRPLAGTPPSLGALDLLGPATGCLLDDGLEGLFEDIDTSMYDSELWAPAPEDLKAAPEGDRARKPLQSWMRPSWTTSWTCWWARRPWSGRQGRGADPPGLCCLAGV